MTKQAYIPSVGRHRHVGAGQANNIIRGDSTQGPRSRAQKRLSDVTMFHNLDGIKVRSVWGYWKLASMLVVANSNM